MSLAGRCILVTRPAAQAAGLCALIERAGGRVLSLPMLEIQPVADPQPLRAALARAAGCDAVIFTSVNALEQALLAGGARWPERVYCIGAATAAAVRRAGLPPPAAPAADFSSEGLLALAGLQSLAGRCVLLVTGEGGRSALEQTLRARGAEVIRANAYCRRPVPHPQALVRSLLSQADSAVVTSGETLERLLQAAAPDLHETLVRLPLVVPSTRVLQMARARGFAAAMRVAQPLSDEGIVRALTEIPARAR